ncbi:MAG TPA: AraC family transcriptional regulator [Thermomicrobiales bacterium]|nr:AraC family transcriptional regulator [Thermomicrobiales bacterium]
MYREIAPPAQLRGRVECFWRRAAGDTRSDGAILPDGCVDVIWIGDAPPFVAGPATAATTSAIAAGVDVVGVRFRPGVAPPLLRVDARDLRDQDVPLRAIWPQERADGWLDAMAPPALPDKLAGLGALIEARLAVAGDGDALARHVVAWIARHPRGGFDDLARQCGVSERQLRRRFETAVGYGPKTLQRILRLQRFLWLASEPDRLRLGLARLAIAAGYADQPHMTREAVALTGATPRQLLRGDRLASAVSELFKTAAREDATLSLPG